MSEDARILEVTGGAGGLAATYAEVRSLASAYDLFGDRLREWADAGRQTMTDDDLLESALLCPHTFAVAEAAVLAATTGPDGVLVESVGWELDALALRAAVAALEAADQAVHEAFEVLDSGACGLLAIRLGTMAPLVGALCVAEQVRPGTLEGLVTDHPALVEHGMNGLIGSGATVLGAVALYGDDGTPLVRPLDVHVPGSDAQPDSLAGLLTHLQHLAALSDGSDSPLNGTIEVQTVTAAGGTVSHIVYLPGTDDMTTLPWTQDDDVRDMGTNLQLMAGQQDTYQEGILLAMHDAGIGPDEPVLLVGHSQGGMAAAVLAAGGDGFKIINAVTAGSPTAQVGGFPDGTHVLSLEHHGDPVPLTDGEPNADSTQQTTVLFDSDIAGGVVTHHGHEAYVAGAVQVDASLHTSVVENLASLHEHGFLGSGPAEVSSQVFQITRDP